MSDTNTTTQVTAAQIEAAKVQHTAAELLICKQYPNLKIVPGSLVQDTAHPVYSNKRRVDVICGCGEKVHRATSDLHTFIGCEECKRDVRRANKIKKKLAAAGIDVTPKETPEQLVARLQAELAAAMAAAQVNTEKETEPATESTNTEPAVA